MYIGSADAIAHAFEQQSGDEVEPWAAVNENFVIEVYASLDAARGNEGHSRALREDLRRTA